MNTSKSALEIVIEHCGGSQSELARRITNAGKKCTQQNVSYWLHEANGKVGPEFVIPIEMAVNAVVTRHDLRPDIFGPAPVRKTAKVA